MCEFLAQVAFSNATDRQIYKHENDEYWSQSGARAGLFWEAFSLVEIEFGQNVLLKTTRL